MAGGCGAPPALSLVGLSQVPVDAGPYGCRPCCTSPRAQVTGTNHTNRKYLPPPKPACVLTLILISGFLM